MGENNALQYADWKRLKFMSDIQNVCPTKLNETTVGNSIQSLFASNVNVYDWTRPISNKNDIYFCLCYNLILFRSSTIPLYLFLFIIENW